MSLILIRLKMPPWRTRDKAILNYRPRRLQKKLLQVNSFRIANLPGLVKSDRSRLFHRLQQSGFTGLYSISSWLSANQRYATILPYPQIVNCMASLNVSALEQVKGDGPPTCFTNFDETGIPDLQAWCHFVTAKSRERASRMFRRDIRVFAMTVQNYIESIGSFTEGDRERLRKQWQSPRRRQSPDSLDEGTDERNNREEERHGTGVEGVSNGVIPLKMCPSFTSLDGIAKNENGVSQKLRKVRSSYWSISRN